jgi:histidine ammonia-lyase
MGEGNCTIPSGDSFETLPAADALKKLGLLALDLGPKEGLSLINGTQLSTALALKAWWEGRHLVAVANMNLALAIEGLRGSHMIPSALVNDAKNQRGCSVAALDVTLWLEGKSEIQDSHVECDMVQDPYSLRCAPLVHGAIIDTLAEASEILEREINSSTDNPLLFPDEDLSLSGGNFHAIYPARVSDGIASALTTLSSISERRTSIAMNKDTSRLPHFLTPNGGLNSGFMMAQVTAAALVSESKVLSFPASVDSIPTSADREDHVSMGPIAGSKAGRIAENTWSVLAIEFLVMCQAIDLLKPLKPSPRLEKIVSDLRKQIPALDQDRYLAKDILLAQEILRKISLDWAHPPNKRN